MADRFLVFVEQRNGIVKKGSLEVLSTARALADQMGGTVDVLICGRDAVTDKIAKFGANRLIQIVPDPDLPSRDALIEAIEQTVRSESPAYVLASATAQGRDVLPAAAARFQVSLIQDCTEIAPDPGGLVIRRPIYAGKAYELLRPIARPSFISLRPNVFPAVERPDVSPEILVRTLPLPVEKLKTIVREIKEAAQGKVELTEAKIIVSGGRGIKGPENYRLIEELAAVLGAASGASRAVVDAGWIDHHHQVGQTGKTVSPTLYIAVGISGAIQHLAGMSTSRYIVAINKDPDAPIFKMANFGIVGDLFKVVPLLTEALKKHLTQ